MPSSASRSFAIAPTATRAHVSRADARSSTLRTSSSSYFITPARSAWPGPRHHHLAPAARGHLLELLLRSTSQALIAAPQLAWSRFATISAIGPPSVRPCRMPPRISAVSCSIRWRGERP